MMADHGRSGMVGRNYSYDITDWKTGTVVQAEVFSSQYLQNGQPLLTHDYPIKSEFLIPSSPTKDDDSHCIVHGIIESE